MKLKPLPTLFAMFLFVVITGFYSIYEADSDGWTEIGFPFPFYIFTGGKIDPATIGLIHPGFSLISFVADLALMMAFIAVANYVVFTYEQRKI